MDVSKRYISTVWVTRNGSVGEYVEVNPWRTRLKRISDPYVFVLSYASDERTLPVPVTPISNIATSALISFLMASTVRGFGATCCICRLCSSVRILESRDPRGEPLTGEAGGDPMVYVRRLKEGNIRVCEEIIVGNRLLHL